MLSYMGAKPVDKKVPANRTKRGGREGEIYETETLYSAYHVKTMIVGVYQTLRECVFVPTENNQQFSSQTLRGILSMLVPQTQ
jgi:hypothetical protein